MGEDAANICQAIFVQPSIAFGIIKERFLPVSNILVVMHAVGRFGKEWHGHKSLEML